MTKPTIALTELVEKGTDADLLKQKRGDQATHRSRGIVPNDPAITRLVGAMLLEQNDEWCLQQRYMQLEAFEAASDNSQTKLSTLIN